jgi:DNA polymerase-3 subunit delta'
VHRAVASASHPDLRILKREINEKTGKRRTKITIEQARETIEFLRRTPALGGWRVVVIDPADDLSEDAADALLKASEEPPARAVFLLVTHAPSLVKPTIRSRCRHLVLQPLNEADFRAVVSRLRPDVDQTSIATLMKLTEGSVGRALALIDARGLSTLSEVETLFAGLPRVEPASLEALVEGVLKRGDDSHRVLRDILLWWIAERVRLGSQRPLARGESAVLDRWAALWENTAQRFVRAEAANLDRKQVLLEILYDFRATAQAA